VKETKSRTKHEEKEEINIKIERKYGSVRAKGKKKL